MSNKQVENDFQRFKNERLLMFYFRGTELMRYFDKQVEIRTHNVICANVVRPKQSVNVEYWVLYQFYLLLSSLFNAQLTQ